MPDYFLSGLTAKTSMVITDLLHVRTAGNIDQKVTLNSFLKDYFRGMISLTLKEMDDALEPDILDDSIVEVDGNVFKLTADLNITGWGGIGNGNDVWVRLVNTAGVLSAEFTTTAPAWSMVKGGWYNASKRYVAWLRKSSTGTAIYKHIFPKDEKSYIEFTETIAIGDWNLQANPTIDIDLEINRNNLRTFDAIVRNDGNTAWYPLGKMGLDNAGGAIDESASLGPEVSTTGLQLRRLNGGPLSGADFNQTSFNRGFVHFRFLVL